MGHRHRIAAVGSALVAATIFTGAAEARDAYFRLFGGFTLPQDEDFQLNGPGGESSSGLDFDSGGAIGGAIGFAYSPNLNIEAEYAYRDADADLDGTRNTSTASTTTNAVMVNALYEFTPAGTEAALRPYLGAGLGVGDLSVERDNLNLDSDYKFAYQFIGGVGYDVSRAGRLFAEVRYFSISDQTVENEDYSFKSGYGTVDVFFGYWYRF